MGLDSAFVSFSVICSNLIATVIWDEAVCTNSILRLLVGVGIQVPGVSTEALQVRVVLKVNNLDSPSKTLGLGKCPLVLLSWQRSDPLFSRASSLRPLHSTCSRPEAFCAFALNSASSK